MYHCVLWQVEERGLDAASHHFVLSQRLHIEFKSTRVENVYSHHQVNELINLNSSIKGFSPQKAGPFLLIS